MGFGDDVANLLGFPFLKQDRSIVATPAGCGSYSSRPLPNFLNRDGKHDQSRY
jgi:hypothetical protein